MDRSKFDELLVRDPDNAKVLELLYDNTEYFKATQIVDMVLNKACDWLAERDPGRKLYVLIGSTEVGSEHWLYLAVRHLLPEHELVGPVRTRPVSKSGPCEVLWIDDWILSGYSMIAGFDELFDKWKPVDAVVNVVCALASPAAFAEFEHIPQFAPVTMGTLYCFQKLKAFRQQVFDAGLGAKEWERFSESYGLETDFGCAVLGDYKTPNAFGSFPAVYDACREKPIDRKFMEAVSKEFGEI